MIFIRVVAIWKELDKNNVKHEYLRSRASRCLTLSSSLAFPGVLEIYRDARAFILDLASYPGIFQSDFTTTQCGNYGNLPPLQKIFVKSIHNIETVE